jgi:hypothetical protein
VDADARTDVAGAAASFLGMWVVMMVCNFSTIQS